MKIKYFILLAALVLAVSSLLTGGSLIRALSVLGIQYPVQELGNCQSEAECKDYCEEAVNSEKCLDFALKNGLMTAQEVEVARKFLNDEIKGPGGCTTKESCEQYCDDIGKIDECIVFTKENNLLNQEELQEFEQIQSAIQRGVKPPSCKNKKECDLYCEESSHMKECIEFGREAGFLKDQELKDAQKMLAAMEKGLTPPPCRGRDSCEAYCSDPEHMEMCMNFAIEAGFMSGQEKEEAEKMLAAIKKGAKPPRCGGREQCDAYCSSQEHFEECINFAEAAGFMKPEEVEMARKTGGRGPGGCSGREACEAFCQNPENQEICFNFAKEHGMISNEEMQKMEEGKQQFSQGLEQAPTEVIECLKSKLGPEVFEKMNSGGMPPRDLGPQIRTCFEMMRPQENQMQMQGQPQPQEGQMQMQGQPQCQTPEECEKMRMMQEQMMHQQQEGQLPLQGSTQPLPEEYQKQYQEQYQQQYEEQQRLQMEQQYQQQQQGQQMPQEPLPSLPPTTSIVKSLLGSLLYSIFQFLMAK